MFSVPFPPNAYNSHQTRYSLPVYPKVKSALHSITFQQIQKYEKGLNRISASRLWYTAQLMNVSVDYFFKDISADLWKESFKLLPPAWKELDIIP